MQIQSVHIENFRCLKDFYVRADNLTRLVGANNAGKSSVLSAIELFFDPSPRLTVLDHYRREIDNPISVTLEFHNLTPGEKTEFGTAVLDGKLRVNREFSCMNSEAAGYSVTANINPDFTAVRMEQNGTKKLSAYRELVSALYAAQLPPVRSGSDVDEALNQWEGKYPDRLVPEKVRGFFGATNVANGKLLKKTNVRLIPAVKDVSGEFRDSRKSPIIGLLSDIARQAMENQEELKKTLEEVKEKISGLINPAKFPQISKISEELSTSLDKYYKGCRIEADWTNEAPITLTYPTPRVQVESGGFLTPIENVGHGLQRAVLFSLIEYLANQSLLSNETTNFGEAVSDIILLVEEPEIYQHPGKQATIAQAFSQISESFNKSTGIRIQTILTTHSEKFVNLATFSEVRIVRRVKIGDEFVSKCKMCGVSEISGELSKCFEPPRSAMSDSQFSAKLHIFSREMNEGFFADRVVLVEGVSDRAALHAAYSLQGRNPDTEGIAIIQADGKTKLDKPWVVFRRLGIPTYVIFDNDAGKPEKKQNTDYNRFLQRVSGLNECQDFPEGIRDAFCALQCDLESVLKEELGDCSVEVYEEVSKDFGVDQGDICKSPAAVKAVFALGSSRGKEFKRFKEILKAVDAAS